MFKKNILAIVFCLAGCLYPGGSSRAGGLTYDFKGKRDPFMPLVTSERQVVSVEDIVSINDVSLEGLAVGRQGKKVAIINGVMLKEGERIGNVELKAIGDKSVKLLIDGGEYELRLPEEER